MVNNADVLLLINALRLQLEGEPAIREDVERQDELLLRKRGVKV